MKKTFVGFRMSALETVKLFTFLAFLFVRAAPFRWRISRCIWLAVGSPIACHSAGDRDYCEKLLHAVLAVVVPTPLSGPGRISVRRTLRVFQSTSLLGAAVVLAVIFLPSPII